MLNFRWSCHPVTFKLIELPIDLLPSWTYDWCCSVKSYQIMQSNRQPFTQLLLVAPARWEVVQRVSCWAKGDQFSIEATLQPKGHKLRPSLTSSSAFWSSFALGNAEAGICFTLKLGYGRLFFVWSYLLLILFFQTSVKSSFLSRPMQGLRFFTTHCTMYSAFWTQ